MVVAPPSSKPRTGPSLHAVAPGRIFADHRHALSHLLTHEHRPAIIALHVVAKPECLRALKPRRPCSFAIVAPATLAFLACCSQPPTTAGPTLTPNRSASRFLQLKACDAPSISPSATT
ncbi:hypothetical protein ACJRO7_020333 [Eucalyptus globulus]|uniref:Uncharacterized protein n=1 Tax=Eucalyptus globulus TaxID=34317 RepID=A0ABD3KGE6_EUCGL